MERVARPKTITYSHINWTRSSKEWDDPSVVPDRPVYADWQGVEGLGLMGDRLFFPHMTDAWQELVDQKEQALDSPSNLVILRDEDAYCVDGARKEVSIFVAETEVIVPN